MPRTSKISPALLAFALMAFEKYPLPLHLVTKKLAVLILTNAPKVHTRDTLFAEIDKALLIVDAKLATLTTSGL